jgi:hypothetical protein
VGRCEMECRKQGNSTDKSSSCDGFHESGPFISFVSSLLTAVADL